MTSNCKLFPSIRSTPTASLVILKMDVDNHSANIRLDMLSGLKPSIINCSRGHKPDMHILISNILSRLRMGRFFVDCAAMSSFVIQTSGHIMLLNHWNIKGLRLTLVYCDRG